MNVVDLPFTVERLRPSEILVDPNSFRIVRNRLLGQIPDDHIADFNVQVEALGELYEFNRVRDDGLVNSMRRFGWIELSPIWARRLANGRLVAVDGNRRLAAFTIRGAVRSETQLSLFNTTGQSSPIEVRVVDRLTSAFSLARGLGAVMPGLAWSPLMEALWHEAHHEHFGERLELARIRRPLVGRYRLLLELTRRFARRFASYPNEAYEAFFDAMGRTRSITSRLVRDNVELNEVLLETLFDWLDRRPSDAYVDDGEVDEPSTPLERIRHLSTLGMLLERSKLTDEEVSADLLDELILSRSALRREVRSYLSPTFEDLAAKGKIDPGLAQLAVKALRTAIEKQGELTVEPGTVAPWDLSAPEDPIAFEQAQFHAFRGLENVSLEGLRRVNLLVGLNNAGKTSVLEALYILTRLADPRGLLDTLRVRTRIDPEQMPEWLARLIDGLSLDLGATVSKLGSLRVKLGRVEAPSGSDIATFIRGFSVSASLGDADYVTETLLYSNRTRSTRFKVGKPAWLASAVLHSPYNPIDPKVRAEWYEASIVHGSRGLIREAIQEAIDPDILDIVLGGDDQPKYRFYVDHRHRGTMDLSNYGEGIQRMFELGNLFAAHKNGIVLIDEIETAIHVRALKRFSMLIHQLAEKFNVQVFATTHSNEVIEEYLRNEEVLEDVAAYLLKRSPTGGVEVRRFDGPKLKRGIEIVDLDIRRL